MLRLLRKHIWIICICLLVSEYAQCISLQEQECKAKLTRRTFLTVTGAFMAAIGLPFGGSIVATGEVATVAAEGTAASQYTLILMNRYTYMAPSMLGNSVMPNHTALASKSMAESILAEIPNAAGLDSAALTNAVNAKLKASMGRLLQSETFHADYLKLSMESLQSAVSNISSNSPEWVQFARQYMYRIDTLASRGVTHYANMGPEQKMFECMNSFVSKRMQLSSTTALAPDSKFAQVVSRETQRIQSELSSMSKEQLKKLAEEHAPKTANSNRSPAETKEEFEDEVEYNADQEYWFEAVVKFNEYY